MDGQPELPQGDGDSMDANGGNANNVPDGIAGTNGHLNVKGDGRHCTANTNKENGEFSDRKQSPSKINNEHKPLLQEPFRKRCDSIPSAEDGDQNESKVLVIYTGGTIGMIRNAEDSK